MNIQAIKAFRDNYIWMLTSDDGQFAVVVDPGEAHRVEATLAASGAKLVAILITHHHYDHTGGAAKLAGSTGATVYGPAVEAQSVVSVPLNDGDTVTIPEIGAQYTVFDIPGHTLGHIAYFGHNQLYCGDTLFGAGCGRVFEGTNTQMLDSLQKLAALPDETEIYCGHEYTLDNLTFARLVEPDNPEIAARAQKAAKQRDNDEITLPSSIFLEKATNPFLRVHTDAVKSAAIQHSGLKPMTSVEIFGIIRAWKNQF